MATKSDLRLGIEVIDIEESGFDTPDEHEDFDYDGGTVDPRLCDKITEKEDCPYNTARRACIDCDVIVHPDELSHVLRHVDYEPEED